jgi:hypothetical protein
MGKKVISREIGTWQRLLLLLFLLGHVVPCVVALAVLVGLCLLPLFFFGFCFFEIGR